MSADAHTVARLIQENAQNTQSFLLVVIFLCFVFMGLVTFANWKREQALTKVLTTLEEQCHCDCDDEEDSS